jgi:hypothetical protein
MCVNALAETWHFPCLPGRAGGSPVAFGASDLSDEGRKMKKIIWMEMVLMGASILVFRSVWTFLDSIPWASGGVGLGVLLVVGVVAACVALRSIEALAEKKGEKPED